MDLGSGRRELHRFSNGESCDECNARRWYADSGFHYCERGHLIQSFVPYDQEDEDNYGVGTGQTSRKAKEKRQRESRHLSGIAARELFLECLQLLLRKQIAWLTQQQQQQQQSQPPQAHASMPTVRPPVAALESVVRDLWDLRVRQFHGLAVLQRHRSRSRSRSQSRSRSRSMSRGASSSGGGGGSDGMMTTSGSESDGRTVYSSQPESSGGGGGSGSTYADSGMDTDGSQVRVRGRRKPRSRSVRQWRSAPDQRWNVPAVTETLAMCYLGGLLLRLPIRVGDLYRWAKHSQIPFLGAFDHIPKPMRERLPSGYQSALMTRSLRFGGGDLHRAIYDLVWGFYANHELSFPGINVPPILWRWVRELGLPIEVYAGVQQLVHASKEDFCYPQQRSRIYALHHPDIFLLATIVFATKLLYPFDDDDDDDDDDDVAVSEPESESDEDMKDDGDDRELAFELAMPAFRMDWKQWMGFFGESPEQPESPQHLKRRDIYKLRAADVWQMTEEQIDDYMDWHQKLKLRDREDSRRLVRLFPIHEARPEAVALDESEEAIDERYKKIQMTCLAPAARTPDPGRSSASASPSPAPTLAPHRGNQGRGHRIYRREADLPDTAFHFYRKAADLGGITVTMLVRAVAMLELRWLAYANLVDKKESSIEPAEEEEERAIAEIMQVPDAIVVDSSPPKTGFVTEYMDGSDIY